jgi:protein-S-isoprenylcysteine O-methyltransferase Ste14
LPSRLRVPFGWATGLVVLVFAHPTLFSLLYGVPLAIAGEAIRIWASGHIEKTARLATGGPYAHSRNPLYLGSLLLALGVGVAASSPWVVLALAVYLALFYPAVIREETAFLRTKFGADYEAWAQVVPVFLPRLTPGGPRASRFQWARVARNREWRTALAMPLLIGLLYARGLFLPW